jgi:cytochrome c biogenesis protein CcmG/thiol:disulfide interchange protein DsbE
VTTAGAWQDELGESDSVGRGSLEDGASDGTDGAAPGQATAVPHHRRTILWATLGVAVVAAALIAVIASSRPSQDVTARSLLLGKQAPPISGAGLAGGYYSLAQFRGRWVLVNFMASWCPPCLQEMPQLEEFARQHAASRDATILTVAWDQTDVGRLRSVLASRHARWPAVNDPEASVYYGVTALPSSYLVAPNGTVYAYVPGAVTASELDRWISAKVGRGQGG